MERSGGVNAEEGVDLPEYQQVVITIYQPEEERHGGCLYDMVQLDGQLHTPRISCQRWVRACGYPVEGGMRESTAEATANPKVTQYSVTSLEELFWHRV